MARNRNNSGLGDFLSGFLDDSYARRAFDVLSRDRKGEARSARPAADADIAAKRRRADALRDAYISAYGGMGFSSLGQHVDTIDEMWEKEKDKQQMDRHRHEAALRRIDEFGDEEGIEGFPRLGAKTPDGKTSQAPGVAQTPGKREGREGFPRLGVGGEGSLRPRVAQIPGIQYSGGNLRYGIIDRSRSEAERKAKEAEAVAKGEWRFNNYAQIELNRRQRRAQQQALMAEAVALDAQDQARNGGPKGVKGVGVYEFGRDGKGNEVRRHSWDPLGTRPDDAINSHVKNASRRAGEAEAGRRESLVQSYRSRLDKAIDKALAPDEDVLKGTAESNAAPVELELARSELFDDSPKSFSDFEPKLGKPRRYFYF